MTTPGRSYPILSKQEAEAVLLRIDAVTLRRAVRVIQRRSRKPRGIMTLALCKAMENWAGRLEDRAQRLKEEKA